MSRRTRYRERHKLFLIVCEGSKTERIYFNNYNKRERPIRILFPYTSDTDPINLVRFAKRQIDKYGIKISEGDKLWCVFDADQNKNENIQKAIKMAGKKVEIILSNPCFELWLLLHFAYWESRLSNNDVLQKLEKYIPGYSKTKDVFADILNNRESAIRNAKKLNRYHLDNGVELISVDSNPSTQVFKIVEHILELETAKSS